MSKRANVVWPCCGGWIFNCDECPCCGAPCPEDAPSELVWAGDPRVEHHPVHGPTTVYDLATGVWRAPDGREWRSDGRRVRD